MSSGYSKELNVQNVRYFMNFQAVQADQFVSVIPGKCHSDDKKLIFT